ncbi:hypothetical protein ACFLEY_05180 [Bradyrhizobium sp. YCK136]|uniref:Uncharacterized protein n=1 Tax=Bradyrhizobium diazoefficiens TaxID=1355477 RepID=A0A0E3VUW3_9BRAD|nr:hypothetical protein [Bradyrhizobium diazoefficiens]MBR0864550.1 hypothetical protein [Bradyrhizobium diazoefficiens]MBR0889125.1 hypothetical protein [Bradyrhizobium diazoefficiens]MBR0920875.1 hypothetical protein [Bradyrhizobium diazoefficiens]WLA66217.1 hypothetical protein QNN01_05145 [Bradyrhizobium diazoefficiens]BAR58110.1 hypothetical protein NK6_4951 [Bradyrhizobium diazoefficiens]
MIKLVSRIDDLREEVQMCKSDGRRKEIVAELKQLRREQGRLSLADREPKVAPLPSSFVDRVKADQKIRARLSGRDKIKVHFVQGGAPGSAK